VPNTERAFTLVELMVSVVILGFGLCIVIQSYISALAGLDISRNAVESARFAQEKMDELTAAVYENNGLVPESESGSAVLGSRQFNWKTEISEIENPEYLTEDFVEARVNVDWRERNIAKNTSLMTYLPKKKKEEDK
jgi:prepilin-type N-terminal cleavage/methylation domain-containing protein